MPNFQLIPQNPAAPLVYIIWVATLTRGTAASTCVRREEYSENKLDCSRNGLNHLNYNFSFEDVDIIDWSHNNLTRFEANNKILEQYLKVNLAHNQISHVEWGNFANSFPKVTKLDFSWNMIEDLNVSTQFRFLNDLKLGHNMIRIVRANSFVSFPKLEVLDLSHNDITSVEPGSMFGLSKLQSLNLARNYLVRWPSRIFNNFKRLWMLDLSYNKLEFIETGCFLNHSSTTFFTFDASGNKIKFIDLDLFTQIKRGMITLNDNYLTNITFTGSKSTCLEQEVTFNFKRNKFYTIPDLSYFMKCPKTLLDMIENPIYCGCVVQTQNFTSLGCRVTSSCFSNKRILKTCDDRTSKVIWKGWDQKPPCSAPEVTRLQKDQQKEYQGFCIADGDPPPSFTLLRKNETMDFMLLPSKKEIIFNVSDGEFVCKVENPYGSSSRALYINNTKPGVIRERVIIQTEPQPGSKYDVGLVAGLTTVLIIVVIVCIVGFFGMKYYFTKKIKRGAPIRGAVSKRISRMFIPKSPSPDLKASVAVKRTFPRNPDVVPSARPVTSLF